MASQAPDNTANGVKNSDEVLGNWAKKGRSQLLVGKGNSPKN